MSQLDKTNYATIKTYKIRGAQIDSTIVFEVKGIDVVRIRHHWWLEYPKRYEPHFNIFLPSWDKSERIECDIWYDIQIARDIYKYLIDINTEVFKPFEPV
jgi:hypothetical protein